MLGDGNDGYDNAWTAASQAILDKWNGESRHPVHARRISLHTEVKAILQDKQQLRSHLAAKGKAYTDDPLKQEEIDTIRITELRNPVDLSKQQTSKSLFAVLKFKQLSSKGKGKEKFVSVKFKKK